MKKSTTRPATAAAIHPNAAIVAGEAIAMRPPAANDGVPAALAAPRAANDDAVPAIGGFARAAVSAPGAGAVAANDNATDAPPPAGSARRASGPPAVWLQDHPHVVGLRADLCGRREASVDIGERRVATGLIACCDDNGLLPSYAGRLARRAFHKRYGIPRRAVDSGPGRALLDEFAGRFRLEAVESKFTSRSACRPRVNLVTVAQDHVVAWERDGVVLPVSADGGVCRRGAARLMGVDYFALRGNRLACEVIEAAVEDGRVALAEQVVAEPYSSPEERAARRAELIAVVRGFDVPGGKVPELASRRGVIDWQYIASLTGRVHPTFERDAEYRAFATGVAARRGLMLPGLMVHDDGIAAFMEWGLACLASENAGKPSGDAIVANHKAALNRFVAAVGAEPHDPATPLFADDAFEGNLATALATFGNPRSAANLRRMVVRWRQLHAARVGAAELPAEVGAALDTVLALRGITPSAFARRLGVAKWVVQKIVTGDKGLTKADIDLLRRAEVELGLPPGTFMSKVTRVFASLARLANATAAYRALGKRIRGALPAEAAFWPEERLAAAVAQVSPLISRGTEYGRRCSMAARAEKRMPPFDPSPHLRAQLDGYRAYKCAPVAFPLIRPARARWTKEGSADLRMRQLGMVFRFIGAPVGNGSASGLGIPAERHSIAMLAHAPFALACVAQRAGRFAEDGGEAAERGRVYTVAERDLISHLVSVTNPVTGYFVQNPSFSQEMVPADARLAPEHADMLKLFGLKGEALLLTEEDVAHARRDWAGYLGRQHQALLGAVAYIDDVLEVSRNPMVPIRGIVDADEPQAELMYALFQAERRWASESVNPFAWRLDVRDAVMHRLAALTALRPDNLATMGYTGDETGEIRKVDGRWQLRIGYRKFKNYKSARLFGTSTARRDYELELPDEAGLGALLDLYFHEVRPRMLTSDDVGAAFLSGKGIPLSARSWYDVVKEFGIKHVAHNPVLGTGIPGVVSINPYCFRHIRASDILKNGLSYNRLEEAAFALQTSEPMIQRHYGFLMPNHAVANANATFSRAVGLAVRRAG